MSSFARTLVTSALPYANGYIHLGHMAGAYLPADIYTRWLRMTGREVIHVSGSDEHGVAIMIAADREGTTPQAVADKYHAANESAFRSFGIDFDVFGRTTWPEHHETAREFFRALYDRGYLAEKTEAQFYDETAQMFLPDRFVEGTCPVCGFEGARGDQCDNCSSTYNQIELKNPLSKITGKPPVLRETRHLYFRFGAFQERLEEYINVHAPEWRDHVVGQSRSWLREGLGDRAITRDLAWGIDVPVDGYEGKKLYVWFDAPFGYITNTKALARERGDDWRKWWQQNDSRYVAFIGKDNIWFHTLMFPAMLMGWNDGGGEQYILPDNVPACNFLNLEGKQFSKSRNWGIDLRDYLASFPPDPLRYTIAANLPENKDTDFTWREFQARTNNELADILGNFVNRTVQFAGRAFDGTVPPIAEDETEMRDALYEALRWIDERDLDETGAQELLETTLGDRLDANDRVLLAAIACAPRIIGGLYESFRFREAALETMNVARAANKYFNDAEPWKTRKSDPARCARSINLALQTVRALAVLFEPIIPFTTAAMRKMLGLEESEPLGWNAAASLPLVSGHRLGEPAILVEKIEDEVVEREVAKLGAPLGEEAGTAAAELPPVAFVPKPEVTIDDVLKLDLRVATVLAAERVKKSNKLLKLQVRIGDTERQIVAGIGKGYEPEALVGRKIVVVANLKPATLMGQESQGMLLAANDPSPDTTQPPVLVTLMDEVVGRDGFDVR